MRLNLLLAAALLSFSAVAKAETRIAFSQKLGIEVLSASPDWCAPTPAFHVVGQSRPTFAQPEFGTLMQRVGGVIAAQCPAATGATFAGSVQGSPDVVWRARADAADQWTLRVVDPGSAPGLSAISGTSTPLPSPRTAVNSDEPSVSPLVGNWVGTTGCNAQDQVDTTVSVSGVAGSTAHAVVQIAPPKFRAQQGLLRFAADGSFDALSGQFVLRPGPVIRANGDAPRQFSGTVDAQAGTMTVEGGCFGSSAPQRLSRANVTPTLARRVAEDRARRAEWTDQAASAPKPEGRLVGYLPPGPLRQPSCPELLAWATASPLDLRVRLQDGSNAGMLRQYDDQTSAAVFGTPAYYWTKVDDNGRTTQSVDPRNIAVQACRGPDQRDPRFNTLMQVASDRYSTMALAGRRRVDDVVDGLAANVATTGGTEAEMYADLTPLTHPDTLPAAFQNLAHLNPQTLTAANQAELTSQARRLQDLLAARAQDEARTAIASAAATPEGLAEVGRVVSTFDASFASSAAAIDGAGAAKRREIADALAQAAVGQVDGAPRTLAGLAAARQTADAAEAQLGHDLPDGGAQIDAALQRYRDAAIPGILAAETAGLANAPATPDGAKDLAERRAEVLDAVGPGQAGAYLAAVDARLDEIARAQAPDLQARLAALDDSWPSVEAARQMGQQAAQTFGTSPAAQSLQDLGHARAGAILAKLADKPVADLGAMTAGSVPQIVALVQAGDADAAPFDRDPDGKAQADRIRKAASGRADQLAHNDLPTYRAALAKAPATRAMARKLATAFVVLDRLKPRVPALGDYVDPTRAAALRIQDAACDQAASDLGLSAAEAKLPMVLGNRVSTLGAFACAARDTGVTAGKLVAPSGGSTDYTFKMFVPPNGGQQQNVLQAQAPAAVANTVEDLFDFTAPDAKAAAAGPDVIYDVHVLMLRKVDIGVDRQALVGVQIGDEAKLTALSVPEWRQMSGGMAGSGQAPAVSAETCAAFAANPAQLPPATAGDALLGCARKP